MIRLPGMLCAACAALSTVAGPGTLRAQHFDVLVQQVDGTLVTGAADFDTNQWTLGRRVYFRDFDSDYAINDPGFNALGSGSPSLPAGSQSLPGNSALEWDFLPMTIDDVARNLFYWDGTDTDGMPGLTPGDVAFGPPPDPDYLLSLFDRSNGKFSVDGSDEIVPGGVIDMTAADGSLHRHRFFFLEDSDGSSTTTPVDGIYLIAMRLRMAGMQDSAPIFMVFGTPGSSIAALDDAAVPWVTERVDTLVLLGVPGDYNADGIVDAADYTVWRDSFGQAIKLPNEAASPNVVDHEDFDVWRLNFGQSSHAEIGNGGVFVDGGQRATIPEPTTMTLALLTAMTIVAVKLPWPTGARRGSGSVPPRR